MLKPKIVFLCHFSSNEIRMHLRLKSYSFRKKLFELRGYKMKSYIDFAIWVSDYIKEFEKYSMFEFYIVAPHIGMKETYQRFDLNKIHYIFFKSNDSMLSNPIGTYFKIGEITNYANNRKKIQRIILSISPDLVILCGAENPSYSTSVLDISDTPIYVIPQTLLNDEKRIKMGVGSPYRRKIELKVFKHAKYFCTSDENIINCVRGVNDNAVFLPTGFPTHRPIIPNTVKKEFDFVFFARKISKNKGIEDLLHSFAIVNKKHRNSTLIIIGSCLADYKTVLDNLIKELNIQNNVHFLGYYEQISDTYRCVTRARVVVLPSITAALNSTVREAMIMGLPTICYETSETASINSGQRCLITVPMNDVNALAEQMQRSLEHPEEFLDVAKNGKEYADGHFSNEAIVDAMLSYCHQIINKQV